MFLQWKAVDRADDDLQVVRDSHWKRLESYQSRWNNIEKGQLKLKQNLVKFNNFIKEKLLKVEEGELRSLQHEEHFSGKKNEAFSLDQQLKAYRKGRDELKCAVEQKQIYSKFLDSVLTVGGGSEWSHIFQVLNIYIELQLLLYRVATIIIHSCYYYYIELQLLFQTIDVMMCRCQSLIKSRDNLQVK